MTSLRAAVTAARDRLRAAGIDDAGLEAELLLRHALAPDGSVDRAALYARFSEGIGPETAARFESFLARRMAREPAAYITGRSEFYGLDLRVTPAVLIPRPETETLVEAAISLASQVSRPGRLRIADVGTGSGAIGIALAKALSAAEVYATDVSREALSVARDNARRHGVGLRVAFRPGHLLEPLTDYVDLIATNLPYVTTRDWQRLPPELHDHEPRLALDGGSDGLDLIRALLRQAPHYLRPGGTVCLEIGNGQSGPLSEVLDVFLPGASYRFLPDLAGKLRVAIVTPRP